MTICRSTGLLHINLATVQKLGGLTSVFIASEYPLGGSLTVSCTISASRTPGSPTTKNATRQPYHSLIQPPTKNPIKMPQLIPVPNMAMAVERRSGGYRSAIIECDGGLEPASPTPTPMRSSNSWIKLVAAAHKAVIKLQRKTEKDIRLRRLLRSAHIAIGIPRVA